MGVLSASVSSVRIIVVQTDPHEAPHVIGSDCISLAEARRSVHALRPLAHLPSGSYAANAAWLAHAVIAFNLARAAGVLASPRHARARWATLREQLINVPARVATTARRLVLHLPTHWPWADAWTRLDERAAGPPPSRTT